MANRFIADFQNTGGIGNLNAYLRIVRGGEVLMEITSPGKFNLHQDTSSTINRSHTAVSRAINRFSIDCGHLHTELQGFSTWLINTRPVRGEDASGGGLFHSAVNGILSVDGVSQYSPEH